MKKRITGVGHRPWSTWDKSEPVMIADGELVRVTYKAYVCINFKSWNNELWPRTWENRHCVWRLESRLFSIYEYDTKFIPARTHSEATFSLYSVLINTEHGAFALDNIKARTQFEAQLVASEMAERHIKFGASFEVRKMNK